MNDLLIFPHVALFECKNYLHEDLPNDIFSDVIVFLFAPLDQRGHVSIFAMFHDNVNLLVRFVDYPV